MVSQEEAVMYALVALMGLLLLTLLLIPSALFVAAIEGAYGGVRDAVSPTTSSTSTTASTTSSTTSSTVSTTTSSTSSTSTTSTSSTSSTTSSTLKGFCRSEADCGGIVVSELKCKGNTIWNYSTAYTCVNRGHPDSYCLGKPKNGPVLACDIYQRCEEGRCITKYLSECDYACDDEGYTLYYCSSSNCSSGDVSVPLSDGPCSDYGSKCCCIDE